jgi:hypothetical protein
LGKFSILTTYPGILGTYPGELFFLKFLFEGNSKVLRGLENFGYTIYLPWKKIIFLVDLRIFKDLILISYPGGKI